MASLIEFTKNFVPRTDKYGLGYINEFYADLFEPIQDQTKRLLEIGIYNGASLLLWKNYFPNADIIGLDINHCPAVDNQERITAIYENAYTQETVAKLSSESFDIIIDDGPHSFESMQFFLINYLPLVKSGGILILEDIVDISWTPKLLELINPNVGSAVVHDMRGKQFVPEWNDHWQIGLDVIVVRKL